MLYLTPAPRRVTPVRYILGMSQWKVTDKPSGVRGGSSASAAQHRAHTIDCRAAWVAKGRGGIDLALRPVWSGRRPTLPGPRAFTPVELSGNSEGPVWSGLFSCEDGGRAGGTGGTSGGGVAPSVVGTAPDPPSAASPRCAGGPRDGVSPVGRGIAVGLSSIPGFSPRFPLARLAECSETQ